MLSFDMALGSGTRPHRFVQNRVPKLLIIAGSEKEVSPRKHGNHGEFCFKNFLRVVDYAWAFDYRRKTIYLRNFLRDFRASVVKRA